MDAGSAPSLKKDGMEPKEIQVKNVGSSADTLIVTFEKMRMIASSSTLSSAPKASSGLAARKASCLALTNSASRRRGSRIASSVGEILTCSESILEACKGLHPSQPVGDLAELDSATAATLALVLKPTLSVYSLLMIVRIVMTWYPEIDGKSFPWSIAYNSTEGLLAGTRKVVKPFNGLDVSPIVWVAVLSFVNEILTGPQGILNLIARKGL